MIRISNNEIDRMYEDVLNLFDNVIRQIRFLEKDLDFGKYIKYEIYWNRLNSLYKDFVYMVKNNVDVDKNWEYFEKHICPYLDDLEDDLLLLIDFDEEDSKHLDQIVQQYQKEITR